MDRLVFANAAGAATLTVLPDKLTYNVGETVTLTVFGDDEGALGYSLYGRLSYEANLLNPGSVGTQVLPGPLPIWIEGMLFQGDGFSTRSAPSTSRASGLRRTIPR